MVCGSVYGNVCGSVRLVIVIGVVAWVCARVVWIVNVVVIVSVVIVSV